MMGAYWYLACDSLTRSATILADDFQKVTIIEKFDFFGRVFHDFLIFLV